MTVMTDSPPTRATWRQWLGLAALALAAFMMATDMTVLFLAQPAIAADLEPTGAQALWILHVGEFLAAGFVLTMGRLTDRIGRRRLLMLGVASYGVMSVAAAFATSPEMLIASRALLGVAAATIMPSSLALIRNMFADPRQFSVAFATVMGTFSAGAALGPPLGGLLLEHFWWGSVFLVNAPAAVIVLVVAALLLPVYRDAEAGRLDIASIALSTLAIMATIFGLQHMADRGFAPGYLGAMVFGLVVAALFVRRQRRLSDPLLDLRLLSTSAMRVSLISMVVMMVAFMGTDMLFAQFLQIGAGLSSGQAGLVLMLAGVAAVLGTMVAAPLLLRWMRPSVVMAVGLGAAAVGFALAVAFLPSAVGGIGLLVAIAVLAGTSMLTMVPLGQIIVTSAPQERTGSAAALSDLSAGLGGAFGMAMIGSMSLLTYRNALAGSAPTGVSSEQLRAAEDSAGGGVAAAEDLGGSAGEQLLDAVRSSLATSTQLAYAVGLTALVGVIMLVLIRLRHVRLDEPAPDPVDANELSRATAQTAPPRS